METHQVVHVESCAVNRSRLTTGRDRSPNTPRAFDSRHVFPPNCQLGYGFGDLSLPVLITAWNRRKIS